jgi:CRP/FNR family cyclic AMP-dependent transcriptional regulator
MAGADSRGQAGMGRLLRMVVIAFPRGVAGMMPLPPPADVAHCDNWLKNAAMDNAQLEMIFARRGWLSHQPDAFRSRFIAMGRLVTLARGAPVFHSGDAAGGVYGIVSGGVAVLGGTRWQAPVLSHIERAGDWFGHGPVLSGRERILTFVAAEPTLLWQVPLEQLRPQLRSDPDFAARLAQMADASTETVIRVARDLLIPDSARRLAAVLLRVTAMGEVPPADLEGYAITQSQLGEMSNISRHQANRILGRLRRAGLIEVGYHSIRLLDVPGLQAFAYAE